MQNENSVIRMVERFGNVCYWGGCIGAFLALLIGFSDDTFNEKPSEDSLEQIFMGIFYALPVWLSGLALRYIFTGRGLLKREAKDSWE